MDTNGYVSLSKTSETEGRQKPSPQEQQTRSNAINLIRARTLTRLSPTEAPSLGDTCSLSSDPFHSSSAQSAYSDLGPVVIMQPIQASKKKKKKKKPPKIRIFHKNSETSADKDQVHMKSESLAQPSNDKDRAMMTVTETQDQKNLQQGQFPLQHDLLNDQPKSQILYTSLFRSETQQSDPQQEGPKNSAETRIPSWNPAGDHKSSLATLQDAPAPSAHNPLLAPFRQHLDLDHDDCKLTSSEKQKGSFTGDITPKAAGCLQHLNVPACDVEGKGTTANAQSWAAVAAKGLSTFSTGSNVQHPPNYKKAKPGSSQPKAVKKKKCSQHKAYPEDRESPKIVTSHAHRSEDVV